MARGGYRPGAGRPPSSPNKSTTEQTKCISELARSYTKEALATLLDVARHGRTDAARVAAATAMLDRGYGRPHTNGDSGPLALSSSPVIFRVVEYDQYT